MKDDAAISSNRTIMCPKCNFINTGDHIRGLIDLKYLKIYIKFFF